MGNISRSRTALMIALLVIMWGLSWPIYKLALHYTPPILFAGTRCFLGGLLLVFYALPRYKQIRWKQSWRIYVISALLNAVLFFVLQTVGLNYLPSGLTSVVVYLQPVLVGVFAWLWLGEELTITKIAGLVIGFVGVGCISAESFSGHISPIGLLLALGSALSWGFGTIYTKKIGNAVDPIWLVAVQFVLGGLGMMGLGTACEHWSAIGWGHTAYLVGLFYGAIFGVAIAWLIYFLLVRSGDASKVASFTFITPLIAVLTGTIFLHEAFTVYLVVGIIMIVVSILLVNRKTKRKSVATQATLEAQVETLVQ